MQRSHVSCIDCINNNNNIGKDYNISVTGTRSRDYIFIGIKKTSFKDTVIKIFS